MIAMSVLTRALGFGPINKKLVTRLVVLGFLTSVSTLAVAVSTADVTLAGGGGGGGGGGGRPLRRRRGRPLRRRRGPLGWRRRRNAF